MNDHLDELNAVKAQLENAREEVWMLKQSLATAASELAESRNAELARFGELQAMADMLAKRKAQTARDWAMARAEVDALHEVNFRLIQRLTVKRAEALRYRLNCRIEMNWLKNEGRAWRARDRCMRVEEILAEARAALETR
jgi:hypothetical protein